MRQKKRFSIILALVMFLSLLPTFSAPALADSIIFDEDQLAVINPRDPDNPFADIIVAPDGKSVTIISVPRQDMVTGSQGYQAYLMCYRYRSTPSAPKGAGRLSSRSR